MPPIDSMGTPMIRKLGSLRPVAVLLISSAWFLAMVGVVVVMGYVNGRSAASEVGIGAVSAGYPPVFLGIVVLPPIVLFVLWLVGRFENR